MYCFRRYSMACLMFLMIITERLNSQWTHADGPYGGNVRCFTVYTEKDGGKTIFAGTSGGGVFCSTNNGASWTIANTGLKNKYIYSLAVSGSNIIAGTMGGPFISNDHGQSWTDVSSSMRSEGISPSVRSLAVIGNNVFAGVYPLGIYRSTDNGENWTFANFSALDANYSLAANDSIVFAALGRFDGGIYRSADSGKTWKATALPLSLYVLSIAVSGSNIAAGTYENGVYLSTDNGASWMAAGYTGSSINVLAIKEDNIFATAYDGACLSTDKGTTWTNISNRLGNKKVNTFKVSGKDIFAGTYDGGIFISTNNGADWNEINTGLTNFETLSLIVKGDTLIAGTSMGIVSFTAADNISLTSEHIAFKDKSVRPLAAEGPNIFAGVEGSMFQSADLGITWAPSGLPSNIGINALAVNKPNIYAGTSSDGVLVSTDNGISWAAINTGLPKSKNWGYPSSSAFAVSGMNIFLGSDRGIFLLDGASKIWNSVNSGISENYSDYYINVTSLALIHDVTGDNNVFAGISGAGVFLSKDDGWNWTKVNTGLKNKNVTALAVKGTNIFAGTDSSIFLSTNNGASWTEVSSELFVNYAISSLAVSGTNLFAGTKGCGVWFRPLSQMITSVSEFSQSELPKKFSLEQNYPNPFNPGTTINYEIQYACSVELKIYDIIGREIATLVNEVKQPGKYKAVWDAGNLSSGIYFYKLSAGEFTKMNKMNLIK